MGSKSLEEIFPLKKIVGFLETISDTFIIGLETPGAKWTQHYQIAVILREETKISDDLKRKLIRYVDENLEYPLSDDERLRAVVAKYHDDIKYCIGYCSKDFVCWKTMPNEFHLECVEHYNSHKNETKIPVSRSRLLPLIRKMYEELGEKLSIDSEAHDKYYKLDNCKKFSVLEKMLIIRGFDLTCIAPSNKREIIYNFDEYIVGSVENHLTDLDLIK